VSLLLYWTSRFGLSHFFLVPHTNHPRLGLLTRRLTSKLVD
jgi:hypothetical protein